MTSRNIAQLAESQSRKWRVAKAEKSDTPFCPVMTIAREHGAGGARLGKLIAERLGYDFWDHEILHEMADHGGISEVLLSSLDEQPRNVFVEAFATYPHFHTTTSDYMRELLLQLHTIAHHGSAVVLGRGAQYTLDPAEAFRVRIIAPREFRIHRIVTRRGIEEREARAEIDRVDTEHAVFIREQWSRDIDDVYAYDLLVNVEHLNTDSAVDGIVAAYMGRFNLSS